jgi:hypothetical protein
MGDSEVEESAAPEPGGIAALQDSMSGQPPCSRTVEEQFEHFYAQYARRVAPLYARQGG